MNGYSFIFSGAVHFEIVYILIILLLTVLVEIRFPVSQ